MIRYLLLACCVIFWVSCQDKDDPKPTIQMKGSRQLGIHVTVSEKNDYATDFAKAKSAGMDAIPQSFYWNEIETSEGFSTTWLKVAGFYYPLQNVQITLTISPIKALERSVPSDLKDKSFADPKLISRFYQLLDSIHKYIPATSLNSIIIGNEVDLYLDAHPDQYISYKTFADSVSAYSKKIWGNNLRTGVETTWSGLTGKNKEQIRSLNKNFDLVVFSYYPLGDHFSMRPNQEIKRDFESAFNFYPGRKMFVEECGYATSSACNSSDEKQAEYISEIFKIWDSHSSELVFVGFLWLNDLSEEQSQTLVELYGMNSNPDKVAFKEYLRTLGICNYNGTEKAGFKKLLEETKKRNW